MKYLVLLLAAAMPVVAWLSNSGLFGPTNGAISDQYPTLIVAAGYAFAVWGLIFALDLIHGVFQLFDRRATARVQRTRPYTAIAFAMTSLWMIVFSLQFFWLALLIIWISLVCLLVAAFALSKEAGGQRGPWWAWTAISLHAGWVSLAAFLNIAQVIVAFRLLSVSHMLPWTLALFALVAVLVVAALVRMRGNPWYALAAVWGLVGVYVKQHASNLDGADVAAWVALALAVLVALVSLRRWCFAAQSRQGRMAA